MTILLTFVPKLFFIPLHSAVDPPDGSICDNSSILEYSNELHAKSAALYRELYGKLQEEIAVTREAVTGVAEARQTEGRNMLSDLQEKLMAMQAKQKEINRNADEILYHSVTQANKKEQIFKNITTVLNDLVTEKDAIKSKLMELKMLENRVKNIGYLSSVILNFSLAINTKYTEQIKVFEESVESAIASVTSDSKEPPIPQPLCPDQLVISPIQAIDDSTVSLIIDSIIKNLTLNNKENLTPVIPKMTNRQYKLQPATKLTSIPSLDFALGSAGSKIVSELTSLTYFHHDLRIDEQMKRYIRSWPPPFNVLGDAVPPVSGLSFINFFHLESILPLGTPEDAISLDTSLGACWPMEGSSGNLTVRLFQPVEVTSITIDHIRRGYATNIQSAPRHFQVFGALMTPDGLTTPPELIGTGEYDVNSDENVQNFSMMAAQETSPSVVYNIVTLRILDNYGHQNFTCLYRLRVHSGV